MQFLSTVLIFFFVLLIVVLSPVSSQYTCGTTVGSTTAYPCNDYTALSAYSTGCFVINVNGTEVSGGNLNTQQYQYLCESGSSYAIVTGGVCSYGGTVNTFCSNWEPFLGSNIGKVSVYCSGGSCIGSPITVIGITYADTQSNSITCGSTGGTASSWGPPTTNHALGYMQFWYNGLTGTISGVSPCWLA